MGYSVSTYIITTIVVFAILAISIYIVVFIHKKHKEDRALLSKSPTYSGSNNNDDENDTLLKQFPNEETMLMVFNRYMEEMIERPCFVILNDFKATFMFCIYLINQQNFDQRIEDFMEKIKNALSSDDLKMYFRNVKAFEEWVNIIKYKNKIFINTFLDQTNAKNPRLNPRISNVVEWSYSSMYEIIYCLVKEQNFKLKKKEIPTVAATVIVETYVLQYGLHVDMLIQSIELFFRNPHMLSDDAFKTTRKDEFLVCDEIFQSGLQELKLYVDNCFRSENFKEISNAEMEEMTKKLPDIQKTLHNGLTHLFSFDEFIEFTKTPFDMCLMKKYLRIFLDDLKESDFFKILEKQFTHGIKEKYSDEIIKEAKVWAVEYFEIMLEFERFYDMILKIIKNIYERVDKNESIYCVNLEIIQKFEVELYKYFAYSHKGYLACINMLVCHEMSLIFSDVLEKSELNENTEACSENE